MRRHTTRFILLAVFCMGLFSKIAQSEPSQTTDTIFMVAPDDFEFNVQTAASNAFQHQETNLAKVTKQAMREFNKMVQKLQSKKVDVIHVHSRRDIVTPDAVFPNNWFSTHKTDKGENILVLYPMLTPNRRAEKRTTLVVNKFKEHHIDFSEIVDLTYFEHENLALEGTGSLVLDRVHQVAFASLSPRTHRRVIEEFNKKLNYRTVLFHSYDQNDKLIYHTNVMMSIGDRFAVICADAIKETKEKKEVLSELKRLNKEIIEISFDQTKNMCGNILELSTKKGKKIIVMSTTAYRSFTKKQKAQLSQFGKLVPVDIHTIEKVGGGSARCMIAEGF